MRILILGGTTEARQLCGLLAQRADLRVTLSLAGRTRAPAPYPVPVRVGGFGGVPGLAAYLVAERVDALVDATHPYAATMSANADEAARLARIPLIGLHRPAWVATAGDRWTEVDDATAAVLALGNLPRRVFVPLGRQELGTFGQASHHHYVFRSVDPVEPALRLPSAAYLTARGPFREADERALLTGYRIETIIAKNSGGVASYGKMTAARSLGIPVILLRRPTRPAAPVVDTVAEVLSWLDSRPPRETGSDVPPAHAPAPGMARGV